MNNIIQVECYHFWSDWTESRMMDIDLDKYAFFEIDYRGEHSWHIKGHRCDDEYNWDVDELSDHGVCGTRETAKFIAYANAYPKFKGKMQDCKVSRFNNLHYSFSFYDELQKLFDIVKEEERKEIN